MTQYSQQCSQGVLQGRSSNISYNTGLNSPSYSFNDPHSQGRNGRNGCSIGFCSCCGPSVNPCKRPGFNSSASNFQERITPNYGFAAMSQQNACNNFNFSPYTFNCSNRTPLTTRFSVTNGNPYFTNSNLTQARFSQHGSTCVNNAYKCCTVHQPSTTTFIQPTTAGTCILIRKTPANNEVTFSFYSAQRCMIVFFK